MLAKTDDAFKYAEGPDLLGKKVLGKKVLGKKVALIEDVVSSGGAILDALEKLKADGIYPTAHECYLIAAAKYPTDRFSSLKL